MINDYVRLVEGVPKPSDFGSRSGTPLVIDSLTGFGYFMQGDVINLMRSPELVTMQAHQGMRKPSDVPFTVNATWHRVTDYEVAIEPIPLGFGYDLAAGTLVPKNTANMLIIVDFELLFTDVNAGQTTNFRIYNVTEGAVIYSSVTAIPIGRNTAGVLVTTSFLAHSLKQDVAYALEIGGGDTLTGCTLAFCQFSMVSMLSLSVPQPPVPPERGFSNGFSLGYH